MIQILSKTKKYITVRMPLQHAYDRNILATKDEPIESFVFGKNIEEVEPYPDEVALIKKYNKMTTEEKGLVSWNEIKKKYAW